MGARRPFVVAHRGAWGPSVPENSLAAFDRAIEVGADMIELDVRRTRDGELIVFHDAEVAGRPVSSLHRAEIAGMAGLSPPALDEALAVARGRVALDVELKEDGYVDEVADVLGGFARGGGDLIVTSFLVDVLAQLRGLLPDASRGLLLSGAPDRASARADACGAAVVLPEARHADESLLAELSAAGKRVIVWDFVAAAHASLLPDTRIDGVITDDVPAAIAARAAARV